jgi:cystathionine beta-lyase
MFDFDHPRERSERTCLKRRESSGAEVALGVADMDFPPPPVVQRALQAWVQHADMGYALPDPDLKPAICDWCAEHYGWSIEPAWVCLLPGVVTGLAMFCHLLPRRGDLVTLTPVYPPFFRVTKAGGRSLRAVPLLDTDQGWRIDWQALERACSGAAGLLLCQPHNPTGRVFNADELARIAALARRHELTLCSDEIWSDLIIDPRLRHLPLQRVPDAPTTLTLMAPSKTFNIPGLGCSFAICPDPRLRQRMTETPDPLVAARERRGLHRGAGGLSRRQRLAAGVPGLPAREPHPCGRSDARPGPAGADAGGHLCGLGARRRRTRCRIAAGRGLPTGRPRHPPWWSVRRRSIRAAERGQPPQGA